MTSKSYDHKCSNTVYVGIYYKISWIIDYYYEECFIRFPRVFSRITDQNGAKKFCKKWGIEFKI